MKSGKQQRLRRYYPTGRDVVYPMRFKSRSSESAEFERGHLAGKAEERALIARKLHKGFECLTAASFAVELAKEPGEQQSELVSRASRLLTEATELLGGVVNDKKDDTLRRRLARRSTTGRQSRPQPLPRSSAVMGQIRPAGR
jgi:hypothetical protein